MQLRRLYLRYYPPALRLEYVHSNGQADLKTIDLPNLSAESNIALLAQQLVHQERLLTKATLSKIKPPTKQCIPAAFSATIPPTTDDQHGLQQERQTSSY
ncbi:hypothetical protein JG687_00003509 [Phytophthora cactorum]|uniref:Centrosomal protein of 19 kDa n=1 Tax=Phytophthora cactorum TaxID=29920 RepID=A0A8T1UW12_9STRA|nr:Centrosomal protein of 19kDa [Phytophthora cactorum]KAG6968906.1 hypothetical protein JG687_00003509 [Phytophthora cactorum]